MQVSHLWRAILSATGTKQSVSYIFELEKSQCFTWTELKAIFLVIQSLINYSRSLISDGQRAVKNFTTSQDPQSLFTLQN